MENGSQPHRSESGSQGDSCGPIFDERRFTSGTPEHAIASATCRDAKTYLTSDEINAAFGLIEHQIMIAGCAEAADHLIRRAKRK